MGKHLEADYLVAQGLVVVEGQNALEASLADRKMLQGIVRAIPKAGYVVVLRHEFLQARLNCQLLGSSFGGQVKSLEAAPSLVCRPKWV
jgi:hypothetical protein